MILLRAHGRPGELIKVREYEDGAAIDFIHAELNELLENGYRWHLDLTEASERDRCIWIESEANILCRKALIEERAVLLGNGPIYAPEPRTIRNINAAVDDILEYLRWSRRQGDEIRVIHNNDLGIYIDSWYLLANHEGY